VAWRALVIFRALWDYFRPGELSKSTGREKRRRFLGIVPSPIIQLCRARIALPGGLLHILSRAPFLSAVVMEVACIERAE
jgi:hypothetical protein